MKRSGRSWLADNLLTRVSILPNPRWQIGSSDTHLLECSNGISCLFDTLATRWTALKELLVCAGKLEVGCICHTVTFEVVSNALYIRSRQPVRMQRDEIEQVGS